MKTKHIESAFRNSTTPAARLAAWQSTPLTATLRASLRRMMTERNNLIKELNA
jgi:hypothetical protein